MYCRHDGALLFIGEGILVCPKIPDLPVHGYIYISEMQYYSLCVVVVEVELDLWSTIS